MTDILFQLERFNDVYFKKDNHTYFVDGVEFTSATKHIGSFQEAFEKDYWLKYKSLQAAGINVKSYKSVKYNVPKNHFYINGDIVYVDDIDIDTSTLEQEWTNKSTTALAKGNLIHDSFERAWFRKLSGIKLVDSFVKNNQHLVPIRMEFIVADYQSKIAGQLDGLFYDKLIKGLVIRDYKTDKEIAYSNRFQTFKPPIEFLSDCNFNKYTLQLNFYKMCIEKYTSLKIQNMAIYHVTDDLISEIEIPDCQDLIKLIL